MNDEIVRLVGRIEELAGRLAALERQRTLEETAQGTMRDTRRCPSCGGRRIAFVERLEAPQNWTLRVSTEGVIFQDAIGRLQCHACLGCGHAELQIENPEDLAKLTWVKELEAPPEPGTPFR